MEQVNREGSLEIQFQVQQAAQSRQRESYSEVEMEH